MIRTYFTPSLKEFIMNGKNSRSWRLNRQINVTMIIQIILLASLIVGSWVNLQRQLDLLQRDVNMLLIGQREFEEKIESLWNKSISYEYRLQAIEKNISKDTF